MTTQTAWENIPHATPETGTEARERMSLVLDKDPFVRMLAPEIRACMVEGIATALIHDRPQKNSAVTGSHASINRQVKQAMDAMPLGFLTDGFVKHVQSLIAYALHPHPTRIDAWDRPI